MMTPCQFVRFHKNDLIALAVFIAILALSTGYNVWDQSDQAVSFRADVFSWSNGHLDITYGVHWNSTEELKKCCSDVWKPKYWWEK
jgi:hypothetical protein